MTGPALRGGPLAGRFSTPDPFPEMQPMKISTVAVAMLFTAAAPVALASTVAEREYQRSYND